MGKILKYRLRPEVGLDKENFDRFILEKLQKAGVRPVYNPVKRSIDARKSTIWVNVEIEVFESPEELPSLTYNKPESVPSNTEEVVIVGAGPAGLFAGLKCLEMGIRPIILERGKDVQSRRRDLASINKEHKVNPESNYCFGEGGAGTYSDGKLYTRSKKRGDVRRILEILVSHGATEDIMVDTHPHIGTNKLPKVVSEIRETIASRGGAIHFNKKVENFLVKQGEIKGVVTSDGDEITGIGVILATGHSARDIYKALDKSKIRIESKPFALGLRVEHPQGLIDQLQYHCDSRGDYLPAAAYSLTTQTMVHQVERGVFSFCMCPGGFIVPSATEDGEVVVNGMSPSKRDSRYANSGIVVAVELEDIARFKDHGALAALEFQSSVEKRACMVAGGTQTAPAQRLTDFTKNVVSGSLPESSYQPGLSSVDMRDVLPKDVHERLRMGFRFFGKKMRGYHTNEAVLVGVESRTSAPVKIPRDKVSLEHVDLRRFYPCGEGAGYAGGIVSAAIDGENCAEALIRKYASGELILSQ